MQTAFVCASFLLLLLSPFSCDAGDHADLEGAPRYAINLDLPAEERWNQVVADFSDDIQVLAKEVQKITNSKIEDEIVGKILAKINNMLSYPYAEEMAGIAKAAEVPLSHIMMLNFMYEMTAFKKPPEYNFTSTVTSRACITILAEEENGTIYLAHNTDYAVAELLRKVTIIVNF